MAEIVRMPKMSDTMTEGVVAKWHKKIGEKIKTGELVAEIETDKATMEFESFQEGVLLYRGVEEGKAAPVDGILAILGSEGEDFNKLLEAEKSKVAEVVAPAPNATPTSVAPAKEPSVTSSSTVVTTVATASNPVASSDGRMKVSPLAKKLAAEKGINLNTVAGSGLEGRIVKRDIDWYKPGSFVASSATSNALTQVKFDDTPVSQMRKTIAKRLSESMFTAPHFYLTMSINMDAIVNTRGRINEAYGLKISFNDFVVKAVAMSLKQHPKVNSSWLGETIRTNHHVNVGIAVAVDEGLLVPVVRYADGKTLSQINAEVKDYAKRAKDKKLQPADWEGNTFTISNLGMYGIEEFTAIINPPDACILAVGGILEKAVVKNGELQVGHEMKVTLSCDHRVVDGATGASFLNTLKTFLEEPLLMLGQGNI
ncbi:MAG: hypothetical protein RIQ89_2187 [Bacteroidota bacterium]|jgi:pyruvate dehydrogenase E2 component (dihydrolipoamide acetyltransferase)